MQLYAPYGSVRYSDGSMPTTYNFTGQRLDDQTGLLYYNARYYDPLVGNFISVDTIQGNPQGMNPFTYVLSNPETLIDPTGHWSWGGFLSSDVAVTSITFTASFTAFATFGLIVSAPAWLPVVTAVAAGIAIASVGYTVTYALSHNGMPNSDQEWDQFGLGLGVSEALGGVSAGLAYGTGSFGGLLFETATGVGGKFGMTMGQAVLTAGYNIANQGGQFFAGVEMAAIGSIVNYTVTPPAPPPPPIWQNDSTGARYKTTSNNDRIYDLQSEHKWAINHDWYSSYNYNNAPVSETRSDSYAEYAAAQVTRVMQITKMINRDAELGY